MEKNNINMKDLHRKISKVQGSWLSELKIDDKVYWNMKTWRCFYHTQHLQALMTNTD